MADKGESIEYDWKSDPLLWICSILLFIPFPTVFFYFNSSQCTMCLYFGVLLIINGLILILAAGYEFKLRGNALNGESIVRTTTLVDTGIYSIIRHPQYLGFLFLVFSVVLFSQHWIGLITGMLGSFLFYLDVLKEEKMSVVKFGYKYRNYMKRVPRMNLLLGLYRLAIRSRVPR